MTGGGIVTDALRELRVIGAAEDPSAEDAAFGLARLNVLLDRWNARREAVYAETKSSLTLTPSLSPHTIGPAASIPTFTVTSRPVAVMACAVVESDTRLPLTIHPGFEWWAGLTSPTLTGTPTDLCYVPDWPLGALYFWPVPDSALSLDLYLRVLLTAFDGATETTLPPGYQDALTKSLAEDLAPAFGEAARLSPLTMQAAARARAAIERNNLLSDRSVVTTGDGLPGGSVGLGDIYTGQRVR